MPRTRSLAWSELKIGVLTIVAIVIAATLVFTLTGNSGFFWQRYWLKTRFSNVAGLAPGSPVRLAGKEIGSVKAVEFAGEQIDVSFQVNKDVRPQITTGSVARLGSVSLLGEGTVDISPSTSGTPIPDWGYVPAAKAPSNISDVTDTANEGIEQITGLVKDLRAGRGTAGKLMTDDRLYTELQAFVVSANELTDSVRRGRGTLGRLINDPKAANALEASLTNVEEMTRRINAGEGSLGKLLKDEAFANSLNGATENLKTLTDRINNGDRTIGRLVTDRELYDKLTGVANHLDDLVTRLNDGEGTMGQLLKDKQLYENMNKSVDEFRGLLAAIRQDPRKYLNVKVSIF
ncbi:MAG TPA: MlaD family protein [Vicinamibacterales bacterium]|nr:MlaD family protein [Vicinamibacterales bacterium]